MKHPRGVEPGEHYQFLDGFLERGFNNPKRPSFVTNSVCVACNTGWMAEIEQEATSIVSGLIAGDKRITISLPDQVKIARWLGVKAIVERYIASPRRHVDPIWLKTFADTHAPPLTWQVLIGRHKGNVPLTLSSRIGAWTVVVPALGAAVPENVLLTMLTAGSFAAQIIGTAWSVPIQFDANRLVQIWPQPSTGLARAAKTGTSNIDWPPKAWIDDEDLVRMRDFPGGID